jgi:hypothetical protein
MPCCTLGHGSRCNIIQYIQDKKLCFCSRMPRSNSDKTRQKLDPTAIRQCIKNTINNNTKVRMAAFNFAISKTKPSCHLLKFQEQESPSDFERTARNVVKNKLLERHRNFNWMTISNWLHNYIRTSRRQKL